MSVLCFITLLSLEPVNCAVYCLTGIVIFVSVLSHHALHANFRIFSCLPCEKKVRQHFAPATQNYNRSMITKRHENVAGYQNKYEKKNRLLSEFIRGIKELSNFFMIGKMPKQLKDIVCYYCYFNSSSKKKTQKITFTTMP